MGGKYSIQFVADGPESTGCIGNSCMTHVNQLDLPVLNSLRTGRLEFHDLPLVTCGKLQSHTRGPPFRGVQVLSKQDSMSMHMVSIMVPGNRARTLTAC